MKINKVGTKYAYSYLIEDIQNCFNILILVYLYLFYRRD